MRNEYKIKFQQDQIVGLKDRISALEGENRRLSEINEMLNNRIIEISAKYESDVYAYLKDANELNALKREYKSKIFELKNVANEYENIMRRLMKDIGK